VAVAAQVLDEMGSGEGGKKLSSGEHVWMAHMP